MRIFCVLFLTLLLGFLTAVLANHWLDDTDSSSLHLCLLGGYFDLVHQSCRSQGHRVPEAAMFKSALEQLGVEPEQVRRHRTLVFPNICRVDVRHLDLVSLRLCKALWVDADEGGVKAAENARIKAVLVTNQDEVLEKVSSFTGIQVLTVLGYFSKPLPPPLPSPSAPTCENKTRGICHRQP